MKKANMRGVRPIIKNHPIMGRLLMVACLLALPVFWVAHALKATWPDVRDEAVQMVGAIFLPWEGDE